MKCFRNMSLVVAVALITVMKKQKHEQQILKSLSLPDFVRENIDDRLRSYLNAIALNGYSKKKIRKVTVLGNKGTFIINDHEL